MEIVTITAAASVLGKVIGLGLKSWEALRQTGLSEKDLAAVQSLIEAASGTAALASTAKPAEARGAALHLALTTAAFGRAFERHWVFTRSFAPSRFKRFIDREEDARAKEIELRLKLAAQKLIEPGDGPLLLQQIAAARALGGSPLGTPYYRQLWQAFSDPNLKLDGEESPLDLTDSTRREFERHFLIAFRELLHSPAGTALLSHKDNMKELEADLVREALVADIATWGTRHVFGNVQRRHWPEGDPLPFMALDEMYVEPDARLGEADPTPVLSLLNDAIERSETRIAVVTAPFGSGKSLSARSFAKQLAVDWLNCDGVVLDRWMPIFIRCADHFLGETFDLDATGGTCQRF